MKASDEVKAAYLKRMASRKPKKNSKSRQITIKPARKLEDIDFIKYKEEIAYQRKWGWR